MVKHRIESINLRLVIWHCTRATCKFSCTHKLSLVIIFLYAQGSIMIEQYNRVKIVALSVPPKPPQITYMYL